MGPGMMRIPLILGSPAFLRGFFGGGALGDGNGGSILLRDESRNRTGNRIELLHRLGRECLIFVVLERRLKECLECVGCP